MSRRHEFSKLGSPRPFQSLDPPPAKANTVVIVQSAHWNAPPAVVEVAASFLVEIMAIALVLPLGGVVGWREHPYNCECSRLLYYLEPMYRQEVS